MQSSERFPDTSGTRALDRRDVLRCAGAVVAGAFMSTPGRASAQAAADTARFFPGFKSFKVEGAGAEITGVVGGRGPALLLLHGASQSHVTWHVVAPLLASDFTVVAADLRGYGDSSKPPDGDNHANYSKRAVALDQVEVMRRLGLSRFTVVGHDRGARVAHRMAIDHQSHVEKLVVLDVVPMYWIYTHVTIAIIQAYYTWFSNARPAPIPENEIKASIDARTTREMSEIQLEFLRTSSRPENIHAMCEDYRAAASIDLQHDEADLRTKINCPVLALWGDKSRNTAGLDVLRLWRERATHVRGKIVPGGHSVHVDAQDIFLTELRAFLKG